MTTDERRIAFRQASFALAEMLGQTPPVGIPLHSLEPGDEFWFPSARPGHRDYLMIVTCDYTVAHADLGCEAEMFSYNKPCRHMKDSHIYVRFNNPDDVAFNPRTPEEERFWSHVDKSGDHWLWIGATNGVYGHFGRGSKSDDTRRMEGSHVTAFEFAYGAPQLHVCHSCDIPLCCRPTCLFEGTAKENSEDSRLKGRKARKLTFEKVAEIRTRIESGEEQRSLAQTYGVHESIISKIKHGQLWPKESEIYVTNQRTQSPSAPSAPPPTDLVVFNGSKVPMLIDFTDVQLANIRDTVCAYKTRDGMVKAPIAFVEQFVASCRATGLNPFLRQIYALPVGPTGWSVFAGIDGYRIAANRGGTYEGMDGPLWAIVTEDGEVPKDSDWVSIPAWQNALKLKDTVANGGNLFCKVILYRRGSQRGFPGLVDFKAYGLDKVGKPGSRWDTDPCGMLAKCAEMQAYRRGWGLETAVLAQIPFEAEQSYELPSSPSVATAGLPEHLRQEIERREAPTQVPMAEDAPADVQEGEYRAVEEQEPPPAPSEPEPAAAEHPGAEVKPAILLTQFARAKRTQLLAANQAIESHFGYIVSQNGGRDLSRLTPEDEAALSDLLRDWLADRAQPHTANPAFNEDAVYVCGTCGVIMLEPKEENPTNA